MKSPNQPRSRLARAVVPAVLSWREHVVDVDQGEHGERADERARLNGDAAPQQGFVTSLVQQRADNHLQVGEDAGEENPGDDLQGAQQGSN